MAFGARNVFGIFEKRAPKGWPKRPAAKEYVILFKPKTRKNMLKCLIVEVLMSLPS